MNVSSRKLAAALASRLSAAVPASFHVRAEGSDLHVLAQDAAVGGSSACAIVSDEDDRSAAQRVETAVRAVLHAVQDCVSESLREPWPVIDGRMAIPAALADDERVQLWFGNDDGSRVIALPDILVADLVGGAA